MSGTPLLQKAVDRLRAASGKYKVQRSTWVLDPQEEDEKIRRILPVLRTDADYIEHEYNLNCLDYATSNLHKIQGCFIEVANPQIVAKFVSDSAAMCDLWTRIAKVCSALHIALLHINEATDGKYRELEHCIFRKAAAKSKPPKKRKRWGYRDTGIMLEVMCESLAESIDTLRSTAMVLLDPWADEH